MEDPKTRREKKKDPRQKAKGNSVYSAKHIRQLEAVKKSK
jgi:hypothetical protein